MTLRARRRGTPATPARRGGGARVGGRGERGVALAISLVLLVVMSVVGIATLSGTRLNEKVVSNAQQKAIAFAVAESAIESARDSVRTEGIASVLGGGGAVPEVSAPVALSSIETRLSGLDQSHGSDTTTDVEAAVTVQYCGEGPPPAGTGLNADLSEAQFVGVLYDINGVASVADSATSANHLARDRVASIQTGLNGFCATPPGT